MRYSKYDGAQIDSIEERIENGMVFECSTTQLVTNSGGNVDWLFVTGNKHCIVYAREVITNGDELEYQAFKSPNIISAGTLVQSVNRNSKDAKSITASLYAGASFSGGVAIPSVYMPGSQTAGHRAAGQFNREGFVRVLEPYTIYGARVTNNGAVASAKAQFYLLWAEVKEDKPFK